MIPLTRAIPECIRGGYIRRCAIQIDIYFTLLYTAYTALAKRRAGENGEAAEAFRLLLAAASMEWNDLSPRDEYCRHRRLAKSPVARP